MGKWREELLEGITSLQGKGNSGKMVVWGDKAEPILAGNYTDQVFMAAAEHGNGRMVVFSQNPYGEAFLQNPDWFSQLRQNIIRWLSKGADVQNVNIVRVRGGTKFDELKVGETIAVVKGSSKGENRDFFQNIEDFVASGGAVVIAETPWGYLQLVGGSIETMPHFKLLTNVGMCFTTKYFSNTGEVMVEDNPANYAHLGRQMKKAQESQESLQQMVNRIVKMISIMPKSLLVSEDVFKEFFETCEEYIKHISTPTSQTPAKEQSAKDFLILYDILLRLNGRKAPGIEDFPGDFESPPPLTKATISLTSTLRDFYPTGYYLPAGQEMKVTVKGTDVQGWKIRIGCHSDNLKNVTKGWKRWPSIMVGRPLSPGETTISSPYGGLIYFESPPAKKSLEVELESIVEAPYFDIKDPEAPSHWKNRKLSPGLWTDLVGEFVIITLPSSSIRNFDHPTDPLTFWDQLMKSYHHLRGTDITLHRRQWLVPDRQPKMGLLHSGYPVVSHMNITDPTKNVFVLNTEFLRTNGSWGIFHEFGHNMQKQEWTFKGSTEVTCNVFALYGGDAVCNIPVWQNYSITRQFTGVQKYLLAGADFETWKKKPGVGLVIYGQLARCFTWDSYKKVFRQYKTDTEHKPKTDQDKIDMWYTRFSETVNYNLAPLFQFWGIPLSDAAKQSMNYLQPFICEDEVTSSARERFEDICSKYPNIFVMEFEIPGYEDCPEDFNGPGCIPEDS